MKKLQYKLFVYLLLPAPGVTKYSSAEELTEQEKAGLLLMGEYNNLAWYVYIFREGYVPGRTGEHPFFFGRQPGPGG